MNESIDNDPSAFAAGELRGHVALKGFFTICAEWQCPAEEKAKLLGGLSSDTLARYQRLPYCELDPELLQRISYILGIYEALRYLYPTAERANRRIRLRTSDHPFDGKSALEFMMQGSMEHLSQTRRYFDNIKAR